MQRREPLYRAYWTFAAERQRIFERRIAGLPEPWTEDPILSRYRFTNPWRASDRVTQFMIRDVIYDQPDMAPEDLVVRIVLARLFSKPSTWRAIEDRLGPVRASTLSDPRLEQLLEELQAAGPIYTSAFILCATKAYGHDRKYLNHLALVSDMVRQRLPRAIASARRLKDVYDALARFPLIGPFMAYQLAIDINYSELVDFSENEFTVPARCRARHSQGVPVREPPRDASHHPADGRRAARGLPRARVEPPTLFGRSLQAIDCQNLFCELDKYARVRYPELRSNRSRIKAQFAPSPEPIRLFYPPKWGINERLPAQLRLFAAA